MVFRAVPNFLSQVRLCLVYNLFFLKATHKHFIHIYLETDLKVNSYIIRHEVQFTLVTAWWQCCARLQTGAHAQFDVNSGSVGRRLGAATADVSVHVLYGSRGWTDNSMGVKLT